MASDLNQPVLLFQPHSALGKRKEVIMFNYEREEEAIESDTEKVMPLKDWRIVCNEHDIQLIKGEAIEVPKIFIVTLKTEKVIKQEL